MRELQKTVIDVEALQRLLDAMAHPCDECRAGVNEPCYSKQAKRYLTIAPGVPSEVHNARKRKANEHAKAVKQAAQRAPLDRWLESNGARLMFSAIPENANRPTRVECYRIGAALAVVLAYPEGGWDIFTPHESNDLEATFADALARVSGRSVTAAREKF
jgi:hypothetical protein